MITVEEGMCTHYTLFNNETVTYCYELVKIWEKGKKKFKILGKIWVVWLQQIEFLPHLLDILSKKKMYYDATGAKLELIE